MFGLAGTREKFAAALLSESASRLVRLVRIHDPGRGQKFYATASDESFD